MLENEKKGLTIEEFVEMWKKAKEFRSLWKIDNNIVVEITGTEIWADSYRIGCYEGVVGYDLVALYYKGKLVAMVELKNIKEVY